MPPFPKSGRRSAAPRMFPRRRRRRLSVEIGRIEQMLDSYMEAQQDFMEEGGLLGD